MPKYNGRMLALRPDSGGDPEVPSSGAADYYERRRQHHTTVRHEAAQRAGLLNIHEASFSEKDVASAAEDLLGLLKHGRTSRVQVEAEQRADQDRLQGWAVTSPTAGSEGAEKLRAIKYRMTVRAKALEAYHAFELTGYLSSARPGQGTDQTKARRPWRRGVAQDSPVY